MTQADLELHTERLRLRRFVAGDLEQLAAFYGDPAVMSIRKYGVLDAAQSAAQLDAIIAHWAEHGFGMYAVLSGTDGRFLGECGLRWLEDGEAVEISYGLWPDARGGGLATEAAHAVLEHGFSKIGLSRIIARAKAANRTSRRVMDKLGMTQDVEYARGGAAGTVEYAVTKKQWRAREGEIEDA